MGTVGILSLVLAGFVFDNSSAFVTGDEGIFDQKLKFAFGKDCKEINRPLRLWLPERRLSISTGEFAIDRDGRVKLAPCSLAVFSEDKQDRVLSTIRAEWVILTLDRPVTELSQIRNRKIIAIEVPGLAGLRADR